MDIYSLIETHVVNQMTPVITLTSIETMAGSPVKYKLFSCNTQWVTVSDNITIDGVVYRVVSFVQNEYLIVTGPSAPVQLYFQLTAPTFEHGTHRRVSSERVKKSASKRAITPMIYALPIKGKKKISIDSMYGFSGKVRFFYLTTFDKNGDATIDTQQTNVVNPMIAMRKYFIQKIEERLDLFEEVQELFEDDFMDFGDPAIWGVKERIFDEFLSGVGVNFDLNIYSQDECCTDTPTVSCLPVKFQIEGVLAETLPSGDTFNLRLIDTDGNIPTHTYNIATDTLEVPAPGSGGSIDISLNANLVFPDQTTDLDIEIIDSTGAPTGNWNGIEYEIDDSTININGNEITTTPPANIVNLQSLNTDDEAVGNIESSTILRIPDVTNDFQGNPISPIPSGQNKYIEVRDADDNPRGNAITDTANILTIVVDSATQTMNGSAISSQLPETAKTFEIRRVNNDPVVVTTITDTETVFIGEVPDVIDVSPIIYIRPANSGYGTTSFLTGDEGWNALNLPPPANPTNGTPALTDPTDPRMLLNNNAFGHKHRFTGVNGGYYDYATLDYKLADGTVSNQATTFGTVAGGTSYLIDNHTGLGWKWNIQGVGTWSAKVTEGLGLSHAGFDDYFLPSRYQCRSLFVVFNFGTNITSLVPFNSVNSLKTSTPTFSTETTNHHQINGAASAVSRSDAINDAAYFCRWHF